jgi:acetyltransferase-like isoleucine patch superfamily enzyme
VSRDARQGRFLTWQSLRWVLRHRAYSPWYVVRYWRFLCFKLRNPHVVTEGFVFLGKRVQVYARKDYGRLILGRWVHLGDGNAIRCHEGTLRIGDKCVFGKDNTVNCFLDIEIGAATIVADWVYICDFDHRFEDLSRPIKDQGIVKSPVRIGPDVWIGTKATVLRGVRVGQGCVVGANSVVNRDLPPHSVAAGIPARVVRNRLETFVRTAAANKSGTGPPRRARRGLPAHPDGPPTAAVSAVRPVPEGRANGRSAQARP